MNFIDLLVWTNSFFYGKSNSTITNWATKLRAGSYVSFFKVLCSSIKEADHKLLIEDQ